VSDDVKDDMLKNFDKITEGMLKSTEESAKGFSEMWKKWGDVISQAVSTVAEIGQAMLDAQKAKSDEMMANIDAALEYQRETIEKAREAELEAEGFAQASSEENLQAQIDAAKESGDEILRYQLSRRLDEKKINDKYDKEAKAAEEKAAREKADIQYKSDKAQWGMDIITGLNAGILGTLQALASAAPPINFILAGLTSTAATVSQAMLMANPPKKPAFASGGIIPGRKSAGDTIPINATAGELILNEAQQDNVLGKMNGGGVIYLTLMMDGRPIAEGCAEYYNNAQVKIQARAIYG
jgi:hypothetical protein